LEVQRLETELLVEVHRFSNEAFDLAKNWAAGKNREEVKEQARKLETRVPEFGKRASEAEAQLRPDLNRALSDARLDLSYILSDGQRPSSTRLLYFQNETRAS
jgi:hypothetical protein